MVGTCKPVLIGKDLYEEARTNVFGNVLNAKFAGNCLMVEVLHPGGCSKDEFDLIWDGNVNRGLHPEVWIKLVNPESFECNNYIYKLMYFDVEPILRELKALKSDTVIFKFVGLSLFYDVPYVFREYLYRRENEISYSNQYFIAKVTEVMEFYERARRFKVEGPYSVVDRSYTPLIIGNYAFNRRVGEWRVFLSDGAVCIREYNNGLLEEEIFVDNAAGKPVSGKFIQYYPGTNKPWWEYSVKSGKRNGTTILYSFKGEKLREEKWKNGFPTFETIEMFLRANPPRAQRSPGTIISDDPFIFADRVVFTQDKTIVFLIYYNQFNVSMNHGIRAEPPGSPNAFELVDPQSGKRARLLKVFSVETQPGSYTPVPIGHLQELVFVFDYIPPTVKQLKLETKMSPNPDASGKEVFQIEEVLLKPIILE